MQDHQDNPQSKAFRRAASKVSWEELAWTLKSSMHIGEQRELEEQKARQKKQPMNGQNQRRGSQRSQAKSVMNNLRPE